MSSGTDDAEGDQRRSRLRAKIFGDVLPEATSDDIDEGGDDSSNDEWLRRQVPPHHG